MKSPASDTPAWLTRVFGNVAPAGALSMMVDRILFGIAALFILCVVICRWS
jgi:hypothetical protein